MEIGDLLKENQSSTYKKLKDKYRFKEEDIKELMGSRRYKRVRGAVRQV